MGVDVWYRIGHCCSFGTVYWSQNGINKGGGDDPVKILIVWELPIWTVTATLYDHSRIRSKIYFWVGGIITILAVIWANS